MGKYIDLDENLIVSLYEKNLSAREIGKMMNVDTATITNRLRKNNIKIVNHRKYQIEEDFFEKIDTEIKAYWLGFIMADGYNSGEFIRIDIQDEGHLNKLRDCIFKNKDMPIRNRMSPTNKNVYYLTLQSKKIVTDCEILGIVKRKSMITKYPNINKNQDRNFIRGLFDGDGCLTYSMDRNYRRYTFTIVGNVDLILSVKQKIEENLDIKISERKNKTIYELYIRGNQKIIKVLEWLYLNSNINLDRKYNKYNDMLYWYKQKELLTKKGGTQQE